MNGAKDYFHQIQLAVFFVCSLAVFGTLHYLSNYIDDRDVSDYLVSLRSEKQVGCLSFYEKKNDILVLGDSHSYTAIDFFKLSDLAGTTKISSCTMGGLYFDSLVELMEKLPSFKSLPTNIIYGLSLRQFTTGSDREKQVKEHGRLISMMGMNAQNVFLKIKENLEALVKQFALGASLVTVRQKSLDYWQPIFSAMNATDVNDVFEQLHHPAKENWRKYIKQLKFLDSNQSNIQRFCDVIQKNNINLFLVDLPESPYVQKMYRPEDLQTYAQIIQQLSVCAKKVVRFSHEQWGIDGRFFLNRDLNTKFDFKELHRGLDKTPADRKALAFDLDHPNLLGAQIITQKMFEEIKTELKYAF